MAVDTAGQNFFGALHQRVAFLEGVGFHGNSCAMILAAIGLPVCYKTVSENPICRREGQACKIERAASCTTHGPHSILWNPASGDRPDRPAAAIAAVRR